MWLWLILGLWLLLSPKSFFKCLSIVGMIVICGILFKSKGLAIFVGFLAFVIKSVPWLFGVLAILDFIGSIFDSKPTNYQSNNSYQKQHSYTYSNSGQQQRQQRSTSSSYYFKGCTTQESLKKRHRELSKKLHPDKGGNTAEFQKMQQEYERMKRSL